MKNGGAYAFDFALEADARRFADDCGAGHPLIPHVTGYKVQIAGTADEHPPSAVTSLLRHYGTLWVEHAATVKDGQFVLGEPMSTSLPEQESIAAALTRLGTQTEQSSDDITAPPPIAKMPGAAILVHLGDLCSNAVMDPAIRPHHVGVAFLLLSMPGEIITKERELKPSDPTPKHDLLAAAAARLLAYPPTPQDVHLAIYFWQRLIDAEVANLQAFPVIIQDNKTGQLGIQRGTLFMPMPKPQAEQLHQQRLDVAQTVAALQRDLGELIRRSIPGHIEALKATLASMKAADEADKGMVYQEGSGERVTVPGAQSLSTDESPPAAADDKVGQVIPGPWSGAPPQ